MFIFFLGKKLSLFWVFTSDLFLMQFYFPVSLCLIISCVEIEDNRSHIAISCFMGRGFAGDLSFCFFDFLFRFVLME